MSSRIELLGSSFPPLFRSTVYDSAFCYLFSASFPSIFLSPFFLLLSFLSFSASFLSFLSFSFSLFFCYFCCLLVLSSPVNVTHFLVQPRPSLVCHTSFTLFFLFPSFSSFSPFLINSFLSFILTSFFLSFFHFVISCP